MKKYSDEWIESGMASHDDIKYLRSELRLFKFLSFVLAISWLFDFIRLQVAK